MSPFNFSPHHAHVARKANAATAAERETGAMSSVDRPRNLSRAAYLLIVDRTVDEAARS
jgi:hypothetical protein